MAYCIICNNADGEVVKPVFGGGFWVSLDRTMGWWPMIVGGFWVTIQISLGAVIIGLILGSIIAYFKMSRSIILRFIAFIYLGVIRGTPAVVQILLISFIFFSGFRGNRVWIGVVALGINSGAYVAEIIRAGILSIDKGQTEAGLSLGFTRFQTMWYIVRPQAVKNILPTYINEFIIMIKETAIVGFVGIQDLTRIGMQIQTRTFDVMPLLVTAVIYLTLLSVLTMFLSLFEKRLRASDLESK